MEDKSNKPCGRGHHKKRKKNARARFDRTWRKNDERHRQQSNKENVEVTPPDSTDALPDHTLLLPKHWQKLSNTQYCKVVEGPSGLGEVTVSVVQDPDSNWNMYDCEKKVPDTCAVLSTFQNSPVTEDKLLELINVIDNAVLCPGNPDEKFTTAVQDKGGSLRGLRGTGEVVAFIDNSVVTDYNRKEYQCTMRRADCEILRERSSQYPLRCKYCQSFRSTLRSLVSRQSIDSGSHTSASSHTRYCDLTPAAKDERMKNLRRALKNSNQKVKRFQAKVDKLIANQAVLLQDRDAADVSQIITEMSPIVKEKFPLVSPQRIFWDQRRRFNSLKDKRQMRWHPLVLRFALKLKYLSDTAYRAIRQSGVVNLPSERTLSDYTHCTASWSVSSDFNPYSKRMYPVDSTSVPSPWTR